VLGVQLRTFLDVISVHQQKEGGKRTRPKDQWGFRLGFREVRGVARMRK